MFLIVDSGSTKADWAAVNASGEVQYFNTNGINPSTQSNFTELGAEPNLVEAIKKADFIWYYGAGVIDEVSKQRIVGWLQLYGSKADIQAESDMLAAARACSGENPGIICILGTGCNSCLYDGEKRIDSVPSLGYILGDEGSGSHIGKEILRAYFCRKMPKNIESQFEAMYSLSRTDLIEKVYLQHAGGSYIAKFADFLKDVDETWKANILTKVFKEFIEYRICTLKDHTSFNIHFVGSIAYFHQKYLQLALNDYGLKMGNVIQKPIDALINYHFKKTYK